MSLSLSWVELVGLTGTALTIATYTMRTMFRLRVTALVGSMFFLTYGLLGGSLTVIVTECLLVPINVVRLRQIRAGAVRPDAAEVRIAELQVKVAELQKEIGRLRAAAEKPIPRRAVRPDTQPAARGVEPRVALAPSVGT